LRVPDDRRHEAKSESAKQQIKPAPLELPAMPRNQSEHQHHGNELERVGVFAKKTEPDE
jgi:hypothetical protein